LLFENNSTPKFLVLITSRYTGFRDLRFLREHMNRSHRVVVRDIQPSIDKLAEIPEALSDSEEPQFFGRVRASESVLRSVDGMSGGHILGFRRNGESGAYWVVAIQSGWLPQRRIVIAYPFPPLARRIEAELMRLATEPDRNNEG